MSAAVAAAASPWLALRDLVLPRRCRVCSSALAGGWPRHVCDRCLEEIEALSFEGVDLCARCGEPVSQPLAAHGGCGGPEAPREGGRREGEARPRPECGECARRPPAFAAAAGFGLYEGRLRAAVLALKFAPRPALSALLAERIARVAKGLPPAEVVVAVPLHRERLAERGFNQAALLARGAARMLGTTYLPRALVRRLPTAKQTRAGRGARRRNVRRSIEVSRRAVPAIAGTRVLLVDDVLTTGATAGACAQALLAAGAREVVVATAARTTRARS